MDVREQPEGLGAKRSPCHGCGFAHRNKNGPPCSDCRARKLYDDSLASPFNELPVRRLCRNGCPEAEARFGLCWRCLEKEAPDPFTRPGFALPLKKREETTRKLPPRKIGKMPCAMGGCPETALYEDGYCELCKEHRKRELGRQGQPKTALTRIMVGHRIRHYTEKKPDLALAERYRELLSDMRKGGL